MLISIGGKKLLGSSESQYVALFGMILILVGQPWGQHALMSLGTWLIFLAAFYDLIKITSMRFLPVPAILLICILLLSLFSMIATFEFSYQSLVALFCFWEIPIFLQFSTQNITNAFREKIYYVFLALAGYYTFLSLSSVSHKFVGSYRTVVLDELTLGYQNPNQTGMYLLTCFFILLSATAYFKKRSKKRLFMIAAAIVASLIIGTRSRACIIFVIIYVIYYLFFSRRLSRSTRLFITKCAFMAPIIMFIFILFFQEAADSLLILGEEFDTGRVSIYQRVFRNYNIVDFILGDFSRYLFGNLHNAYLSVFATAGFFTMVFYIVYLRNKFLEIQKSAKHRHQSLAFFGLTLLVVHMSVEAAFFTAGSVYAISVICLAWISSDLHEDSIKHE